MFRTRCMSCHLLISIVTLLLAGLSLVACTTPAPEAASPPAAPAAPQAAPLQAPPPAPTVAPPTTVPVAQKAAPAQAPTMPPPSAPSKAAPTTAPTQASAVAGAPKTAASLPLPIFDTHTHYSQNSWEGYSPEAIIAKLKKLGVVRALVSSSPDDGTRRLYELDPGRIVPILRPYRDDVGSSNWAQREDTIPYLEKRLETPIYRGIGEIHVSSERDATSPVVRKTVDLALKHDLYLHIHSSAQPIRLILGYKPQARVLWAHAGLSEPPSVVAEMLDTYSGLTTEIAIRESEIAPGGKLDPVWRDLFLKYPDRIMIGMDTWVPGRWDDYERLVEHNRTWLNQLPRAVAEKIAYRNAVRLFGAGPNKDLED